MIRSQIHTRDSGAEKMKALLTKLKAYRGAFVSVGIHEDAGSYQGTNAPDVVEVALWNEFGTRTAPARSFMASTIDENGPLIEAWREEMITNILEHGWTVEKALEAMGFRIQTLIQNKIGSNVPPPNAPSTAAAKARDGVAADTLIHTRLMQRAVTFKVHLK